MKTRLFGHACVNSRVQRNKKETRDTKKTQHQTGRHPVWCWVAKREAGLHASTAAPAPACDPGSGWSGCGACGRQARPSQYYRRTPRQAGAGGIKVPEQTRCCGRQPGSYAHSGAAHEACAPRALTARPCRQYQPVQPRLCGPWRQVWQRIWDYGNETSAGPRFDFWSYLGYFLSPTGRACP